MTHLLMDSNIKADKRKGTNMISASNISLRVGKKALFEDVNIKFTEGNCYGLIGANGAGKTTLLQVLSGELELDGDDKRMGPGITMSRRLTVGMLKQGVFTGDDRTVEEELLAACPCKDTFERERFEYEQEYDRLFTGFGLKREDKKRLLSSFSGGEKEGGGKPDGVEPI